MSMLWLVGRWKEGDDAPWEVMGVFSTERRAVNACSKKNDFVGPLRLNKKLGDCVMSWPGAYYPKVGEKTRGVNHVRKTR